MRVQHELAEVRAEQDIRVGTGARSPSAPVRSRRPARGETKADRRELGASLTLTRPGSPTRASIQAQDGPPSTPSLPLGDTRPPSEPGRRLVRRGH
jgi:hypothetical protein